MKKSGFAVTECGLQEMRRVVTSKHGKNYVRYHGKMQEVVLFQDLDTWLSVEFVKKIQGPADYLPKIGEHVQVKEHLPVWGGLTGYVIASGEDDTLVHFEDRRRHPFDASDLMPIDVKCHACGKLIPGPVDACDCILCDDCTEEYIRLVKEQAE